MPEPEPQIVATDILYYHSVDEDMFFEWLDRMPFVQEYYGVSRDLFIVFNRLPTNDDMLEIVAFCKRYDIEMRQLAKFVTEENRDWARRAWGAAIFGLSE